MRFVCLAILLLAGCSEDGVSNDGLVGVYRGPGRDTLCVAREGEALKAGFITYGDEDANCSLAGRADVRGESLTLAPDGDSECSVEIRIANGVASVGPRTQACDYYCGPGADYAGRQLRKLPDAPAKATDFAGDPLC